MKPKTYYCHAITKSNGKSQVLKAIYNPDTQVANIFKVTPQEDIILATLNAEEGLVEMALFDFCLDLIEEELEVSDIVKASLSEEKSYLIL